jgi:hypothetical protein
MRYAFHPEALNEYAEAVQYYTEQRIEVAQAFINAIEDTVYRMGLLELRWHWIASDTKIRIGRTAVTPLQSWF